MYSYVSKVRHSKVLNKSLRTFILQLFPVLLGVSNPIIISHTRLLQSSSLLVMDSLHSLLPRDPLLGGCGGHLYPGAGGQVDRATVGCHGDDHLLCHRQHRGGSHVSILLLPPLHVHIQHWATIWCPHSWVVRIPGRLGLHKLCLRLCNMSVQV